MKISLGKSRKHFNTVYMFDKTMLGRVANKIPTFEIRGKNVIEFYPGFGLLSTRCAFSLINSLRNHHYVIICVTDNQQFLEYLKKNLYLILLLNLTSVLFNHLVAWHKLLKIMASEVESFELNLLNMIFINFTFQKLEGQWWVLGSSSIKILI